jgi:hypothetical protein
VSRYDAGEDTPVVLPRQCADFVRQSREALLASTARIASGPRNPNGRRHPAWRLPPKCKAAAEAPDARAAAALVRSFHFDAVNLAA